MNNMLEFAIAFPKVTTSNVLEVWNKLSSYLEQNNFLSKQYELSQIAGHAEEYHTTEPLLLSPEGVAEIIVNRKLNGFWVSNGIFGNNRSVDFRLLGAKNLGNQSSLTCRIEANAESPDNWNLLIENLADFLPLIGAWQYHSLYHHWQNSVNPEVYVRRYGALASLARTYIRKSIDGIGQDRLFIDTSLNPGRTKEFIPTIYFQPTAEMWLGQHFWDYSPCKKEDVLAAEFFIEKRDTPNFLYLKSFSTPFTRPDGDQGRMQQRLWKLLFHEDCEWPPGSSSISDEAIYGPLELMPNY